MSTKIEAVHGHSIVSGSAQTIVGYTSSYAVVTAAVGSTTGIVHTTIPTPAHSNPLTATKIQGHVESSGGATVGSYEIWSGSRRIQGPTTVGRGTNFTLDISPAVTIDHGTGIGVTFNLSLPVGSALRISSVALSF